MKKYNCDYKISVIMPVYGGEKYIEQCIDSVISQTYSNLEIIVVNDGSPDLCPQIIDHYAEKDRRIIAIHKDNSGYGAAINSGLDIASGDFIAIVETDDWISHDMFERLLNAYEQKPNPIVKASFNRIKDGVLVNTQSFDHLCQFDSKNLAEQSPKDAIELFLLESSIWTAIYRKEFLDENNIRFLESPGASYQDMPFKFICYSLVDKVTLLNSPVYNYRVMNEGSSSASSDKALISFNNYDVIKGFLKRAGIFDDFIKSFYYHQMFDVVFHASRLRGEGLDSYLQKVKSTITEAKEEGFDPVVDSSIFSSCTNDYYINSVLPIFNRLNESGIVNRYLVKNRIRRYLIGKLRYIVSKLVVEPVVSKLDSVFSGFLLSYSKSHENELSEINGKIENIISTVQQFNLNASSIVSINVAPTDQFYYFVKAHEERIKDLRRDFQKGLDEFSLLNEKKLFGFYEILPHHKHKGLKLDFPLSLSLFTDEDRIILLNYVQIMKREFESYQHLDLTELPISLATNYFKSGLKYLPNRITENFPGKLAIDCGAWVGDTSIMFASFGFKQVLALEPMPENYSCLERNLERNSQILGDTVIPIDVAVGDVEGNVSMLTVGSDGAESCVIDVETDNSISVRSSMIDNIIQETNSESEEVGLIKFDVEGFELNALKGAAKTIRKHKPVLLISVYHLWLQPEQIFECKKFVENLDMGYQFKFVHLQPEKDLVYEYMLVCW